MNRPVFYDDSGVRAVAIQWTGRAGFLLAALVCLALAATLGAHVPLPGLERLNPFAALTQRFEASRNADRHDAAEPGPSQIVDETDGRVGAEQVQAIKPESTVPTEKVAKPDARRSAASGAGTSPKVVGSPSSKPSAGSGRTADATPAGRPAVSTPAGLTGRGHADRTKSNQAKAVEHAARPSHPASPVAAGTSKRGDQARTRPAKAAEMSSRSRQKPPTANAKP